MRFRSISIENYRQYRKLELEFRPGAHDLQVIVADNGVGKTNLLNAFTWCLYDEEPHLGTSESSKKNQRDEPKLNKEVIEKCAREGIPNASVCVCIDIEIERDGKKKIIRVRRSLPFVIKTDGSFFEKTADKRFDVAFIGGGEGLPLHGEAAVEYVNKLLPKSIHSYFFFDGEQLDTYFKATSGERIKEAVYSISQIDLFRTMIGRLEKVIKDKRREASSCSSNTENYEKKLDDAERLANGCKNFIAEKESKLEELNQRLTEIDDKLRGVDDVRDIEDRRAHAQKKVDALMTRLQNQRSIYYDFVRNRIVDFYLYPASVGALEQIQSLEQRGQLPPTIDSAKLLESLREGHCVVCRHELDDADRRHIEELLKQFSVGSETSNILSSMTSELKRSKDAVLRYPEDRRRHIAELAAIEKDLDSAEDELKRIEQLAGKYADTAEGIKQLYDDRAAYYNEIGAIREQIGTRRNNIARAEADIAKYQKLLDKALQQNSKAAKLRNIIRFGESALKILKNAESSVIHDTKACMERRTEELFKGLIWKNSKCDHIELSDNYTPSLYDEAGFSCAGTCSAAERSLLALSFTLALHEVSGFDSPIFIDTPIARASGENRENFAKTLVNVSEHKQLILAFTPDEYSESISNEFDPAASTFIKLHLDQSESYVEEPEVVYHA